MKEKPLHICIEGPDNIGKSTQIQQIKNYFNHNVFITLSHGNTKQLFKEDYIDYNKQLFTGMFETIANNDYTGYSTICDRSHIGEMVYAPIYRSYNGDYIYDIEKQYLDLGIILILYTDKPENLIDRDDGLSFSTDLADKKKEIKKFKNAFDKSKLDKILIDISGKTEREVANETIRELLKKIKEQKDENA